MLDRNRVGGGSCYIRDLCIHIHIRYTRVITVQRLKSQSLTSSSVYISGDTEFCSWIRSISCEFAAISTASNNHKEDMVLLRYTCIHIYMRYVHIHILQRNAGRFGLRNRSSSSCWSLRYWPLERVPPSSFFFVTRSNQYRYLYVQSVLGERCLPLPHVLLSWLKSAVTIASRDYTVTMSVCHSM